LRGLVVSCELDEGDDKGELWVRGEGDEGDVLPGDSFDVERNEFRRIKETTLESSDVFNAWSNPYLSGPGNMMERGSTSSTSTRPMALGTEQVRWEV